MKVCIVGAGAIGSWIGARLAASGNEVCLVARGAHLAALLAGGLTLVSKEGRQTMALRASDRPEELGVQHAVFLTLKAHSIGPMLPALAPLLGPETVVVPAINGIPWWYFHREGGRFDGSAVACVDPGGTMLRNLDPGRIVGCVVHGSAEVTGPAVVTNTAGNHLVVGEPDNSSSRRLSRVAELLQDAGFDVTVSTNIRRDVWTKLIGNLSYNPVAALTLARMDEINANPGLVTLIRAMMEEAMGVAEAYGVKIEISIDERIELSRKIGAAKISMHQDVEKGRPLEVDAILGAVAELARRAELATPLIDAVHALVEERARHLSGR